MAAAGVALPAAEPGRNGPPLVALPRVSGAAEGVDPRLLQLCCPLLEHARRALQARAVAPTERVTGA